MAAIRASSASLSTTATSHSAWASTYSSSRSPIRDDSGTSTAPQPRTARSVTSQRHWFSPISATLRPGLRPTVMRPVPSSRTAV